MSKPTPIPIKANGVRNELKEIRKSIDKLTNVFHHAIDLWSASGLEQTNKHEKTNSGVDVASSWMHIEADYD